MGDEAVELHRVLKAGRDGAPPSFELQARGLTVERVVQLDGVEPLGVPLEPTRARKIFWVKGPAAVPVPPAWGAPAPPPSPRNSLGACDSSPSRGSRSARGPSAAARAR